ncbi:GTP-binding protein [Bremerella cremea]|uniref:GTP-binding protein n=1 Tax=Bremerella cremea TaxID=1031537 RepID=A0A368KV80_9BACT|nr:GTPase [Bremerella cremea]RCS52792.1 GTP-binding protein [Bremerella cremea]
MTAASAKTFAAVLTPPARGAIATVAVRGQAAVVWSDRFFTSFSKVPLCQAEVGRILVGQWQAEEEELGEELVVAKLAEDYVEIHCHGGVQASRRIVKHLESVGCEIGTWQQWTRREAADAIVAEAQIALPEAATQQAALHLIDQAAGALSHRVSAIVRDIEDGNFEIAQQQIAQLLRFAPFGQHLTRPWSVVLAGPPNVGKSSLLNKMLGYDRAIVLDMPGTTRDVLHATTALDGWPVQFSDTAGIRLSDDQVEQAGILKAKAALEQADAVLVLHDATNLRPHELDDSLKQLPAALHVVNKIDLANDLQLPEGGEMLATSAVTGQGVPELISAIVTQLVPVRPDVGQAIPFTLRQLDHLEQAQQLLQNQLPAPASQRLSDLLNLTSFPADNS